MRNPFRPYALMTVAAMVAGGAVVVVAPPAFAQFPGTNGDLLFTSERDGNREIYRRPIDGGPLIRLTNNSVEDSDPQVSPDGGGIAFVSNRDGNLEIFTMNLVGGSVQQITSTGGGISNLQPSWSPDGSRIVFASNRFGDYEILSAGSGGIEISTTQLTNNSVNDTGPVYSPNGTRVLFTSNTASGFDLYETDPLNTVVSNRITFNSATDFGGDYLPDGSGILFASDRTGNYEIFRTTLGSNMADADANAVNLSNRPGANDSEPQATPDGTGIHWEGFSPESGSFQIFNSTISGNTPGQITDTPQRNGDPVMGVRVPECRDTEDNDEDGWTDYPDDPGCDSGDDESEGPNPQCSDGLDNDGDGFIDFDPPAPSHDPSCTDLRDPSEGRVRVVLTTFTSFRHDDPFRGRIDAATRRCTENRMIRVRSKRPGSDPLVAADVTDGTGKFVARHARNLHQQRQSFYAQAVKSGYFTADFEVYIRCAGEKSPSLVVPAGG